MVFDLPDSVEPFANRIKHMEKIIDYSESPFIELVRHEIC